jgi:hypothetical protein
LLLYTLSDPFCCHPVSAPASSAANQALIILEPTTDRTAYHLFHPLSPITSLTSAGAKIVVYYSVRIRLWITKASSPSMLPNDLDCIVVELGNPNKPKFLLPQHHRQRQQIKNERYGCCMISVVASALSTPPSSLLFAVGGRRPTPIGVLTMKVQSPASRPNKYASHLTSTGKCKQLRAAIVLTLWTRRRVSTSSVVGLTSINTLERWFVAG